MSQLFRIIIPLLSSTDSPTALFSLLNLAWRNSEWWLIFSADAVDLGQLAKSGAKKLWKRVRSDSASSAASNSTNGASNGNGGGKRSGLFGRSPSASNAPLPGSEPDQPRMMLSPDGRSIPVPIPGQSSTPPELDTVVEEEVSTSPKAVIHERPRPRSPPPLPTSPVEEEEEEGEAELEAETRAQAPTGTGANVDTGAEAEAEDMTYNISQDLDSLDLNVSSGASTPRPRKAYGLTHHDLYTVERNLATIGYNEARHQR